MTLKTSELKRCRAQTAAANSKLGLHSLCTYISARGVIKAINGIILLSYPQVSDLQ